LNVIPSVELANQLESTEHFQCIFPFDRILTLSQTSIVTPTVHLISFSTNNSTMYISPLPRLCRQQSCSVGSVVAIQQS
jgi:hypothetical protein